jgi:RNA polymerase sigma-70 factor (ECF subfamily)
MVSPPVPPGFAHLSDEALVAMVARSDDEALAELYDRYAGVAFGLARRVVRDAELAEDAVQETFLAVWRTAARFTAERSSARAWILMLTHRRAVDLVRSNERRRADRLPEGFDGVDAESPEPADAVWLGLQRERVVHGLAQLPDQQREAIELAYFGGFTQSELADRLGQPLGTIKSRMHTGLSRLRELLDDDPARGGTWSAKRSTT